MVPQTDQDTELASIKAGQVDYIYPQFGGRVRARSIGDPNIKLDIQNGGDYEGLYFQQARRSVRRSGLPQRASPSRSTARPCSTRSTGRSSRGRHRGLAAASAARSSRARTAPTTSSRTRYDPAAAEQAPDRRRLGEERRRASGPRTASRPTLRWMVNAGNTRRENTQAYLIPLLQTAGLQRRRRQLRRGLRLPAAAAVRSTSTWRCTSTRRRRTRRTYAAVHVRPDPDGGERQQGPEQHGLVQRGGVGRSARGRRARPIEAARTELIPDRRSWRGRANAMLPLVPFPKTGVWRTDQVGGAGRRRDRQLPTASTTSTDVGGRRRRRPDRHRCRAVAGVPQPDHGVRQLVVVRLDGLVPDAPRRSGTPRNDGQYVPPNLLTGEAGRSTSLSRGAVQTVVT